MAASGRQVAGLAVLLAGSIFSVHCGDGGAAAGKGGAAGATGSAGRAGAGGASQVGGAGGGNGVGALQAAELATAFDPDLLTYSHEQDPSTGDQTPIGWGPSTLPSQAQADAATALVRRIAALLPNSVRNSTNTANAVPGTPSSPSSNVPNPANGLLTLGADPASLISGTNLGPAASTALEAFRTAAVADSAVPRGAIDPGGLTASAAADDGTLCSYVAIEAVDPSSAIGIAVNVVTVAVQYGLVGDLQAF